MSDEFELCRERTLRFLYDCRGCGVRVDGDTDTAHAEQVADMAEALCRRHILATRGVILPPTQTTITAVWHAGLLHEVVTRCGCTYEDLCALTSLEVADFVCQISRDNRLPLPRRNLDYVSRLGQATIPAQLVALSDIAANLSGALRAYKACAVTDQVELPSWVPQVLDNLDALHRLKQFTELREAWERCEQAAHYLLRTIEAAKARMRVQALVSKKKHTKPRKSKSRRKAKASAG